LPFIQELPEHVSRKVRSSVVVPSLSQLTEELVCNSLDAGATEVTVTVDSSAVTVRVDDNGCGISRDDLVLLGERQATSKLQSITELEAGPTTLGFRGEALFSIMGLSLVEIVTRSKGSASTYCKICKGGRTLSIGMTKKHRSIGTTVLVQDIFFNQPVRQQLAEKNLSKEIQSIQDRVGHLGFMHPQVSFMVSDVARSKTLLSLSGGRSVGSSIKDVFGAAILQSMKEIDYQKGNLRLSGFISQLVQQESSRDVQYLYINKRLVKHTRLHKLLNSSFSTSLSLHSKAGSKLTSFQDLMFVVNLSCPQSSYDITFEPTKTYVEFKNWKTVLEFFQEVLSDMWSCSKTSLVESGPTLQPTKKKSQKPWQKVDPNYRPSYRVSLSDKPRKGRHGTGHLIFPEESDESLPDLSKNAYSLRSKAREASVTQRDNKRQLDLDQDSVCTPQPSPPDINLDNASWRTHQPSSPNKALQRDYRAVVDTASPEVSPFASARDSFVPSIVAEGNRSRFRKDHDLDLLASNQHDWSLDLQLHPDGLDIGTSRCLFERAGHADQRSPEPVPKRRKRALLEGVRHSEGKGSSRTPSVIDPEEVPDEASMLVGMQTLQDIHLQQPSVIAPEFPAVGSLEYKKVVELIDPPSELPPDPPSHKQPSAVGNDKHKTWGLVSCGGVSETAKPANKGIQEHGLMPGALAASPLVIAEEAGSKHQQASALLTVVQNVGPVDGREESVPAPAHLAIVEAHHADEVAGCCCSSKWRDGHAPACTEKNNPSLTKSVKEMYQHWCKSSILGKEELEPEILDLQTLASRSMQFDSHRRQRGPLIPTFVSKETLLQAKCLNQVDGKFLVATSGSTVVAIDQHAADERVCLEELRKEVLENESAVVPLLLDSPSDLPITAGQEGCLRSYRRQIERWGWRFKLSSTSQAEKSIRTQCPTQVGADALAVLCQSRHSGPSQCTPKRLLVLAVPHLLGTSLRAEDILDYLLQLQETGGVASTPPRAVLLMLASKACRGAIMFGDMLKTSECCQLIECLKHTQLPFQCAHGRPTMVPLMDLEELKRLVGGMELQGNQKLEDNQNLFQDPSTGSAVHNTRLLGGCLPSQIPHSQPRAVDIVKLRRNLANAVSFL
ncbi:hypothetical protein CLOM_g12465, partial [Closterium sp. NIES-68]